MPKEPCSDLQVVAALKGMVDARKGWDSSKAFEVYDPKVYKKYLEGYMQGERTIKASTPAGKWSNFVKKRPWLDLSHVQDPSAVLGKNYVQPIMDAGIEWNKAVRKAKAKGNVQRQKELWEDIVKPVADDLLEAVEYDIPSPSKRHYATRYLQDMSQGTEVFGSKNMSPWDRLADVQVQALVSNNPVIFGLNFLEYNRAISVLGPQRMAAGLLKAAKKQRLQFWKEVPELKELGLYGRPSEESKPALISASDNWLRTAAYYAGESFGKGEKAGLDAAKRIAFAYQVGNMPEMIRNNQSRSNITLMRYGIEMYKFLGQGVKDMSVGLAQKDLKKAAAGAWLLGSWALTQSLVTGKRSMVPEPVWEIMEWAGFENDEDSIWTDGEHTNMLAKVTGVDLSRKQQPGNISLGVKWAIWARNLGKTSKEFKSAIDAAKDGDEKEAWLHGGKAAMKSVGTALGLPLLLDINVDKAYDVMAEVVRGETELKDAPIRAVEKTVPLVEPVTEKGIEQQRRAARYQ